MMNESLIKQKHKQYLCNVSFKLIDISIFKFDEEKKRYCFLYTFNTFNWEKKEIGTVYIPAKTIIEAESVLKMIFNF